MVLLQSAPQIIGTDISIGVIETPNADEFANDRYARSLEPESLLFPGTALYTRKPSPARPSVELENANEKMTRC